MNCLIDDGGNNMRKITLGELAYKLEMELLRRSKDCTIILDITKDGEEYIHIRGDGLITTIDMQKDHYLGETFEKRAYEQMLGFNKKINEKVSEKGFVDESDLKEIYEKQKEKKCYI